jgi:stage II sporulation protein D
MRERRARRGTAIALVTVVVGLLVGPASAAAQPETVSGPVRFEAGPGTVLELDDGRRFLDTLEVRLTPGGSPVLINELSMDDYLAGVAEMPPRWHPEALKAQAVAARSYVWRAIQRGTYESRGLGYDICGTVACQVFTGTRVVEESPLGQRWRDAVDETSGQVLLDDEGRPILARYFSSSGGRTLPNEVVFPETGSFPYLVGVEDPDDELSPLHRWEATFTRDEFDDVLSRGESLGAAVPVAEVERDGGVRDPHAEVVVTGQDGTTVRVGAQAFREFVSRVAPQRHPERFPGTRPDGARTMPATLPSSRFSFEVTDEEVVIRGLGWGHGVGMGQYGAQGKAMRGLDHAEILAEYYNGLAPESHGDLPERVRVGLDLEATSGIRADGPVRLVADGEEVTSRALGRWGVEAADGGLRLVPPEARERGLEVGPTVRAGQALGGRDHLAVEASVNKPVELRLVVRDDQGDRVLRRDLGVADEGTHGATWRYEDQEGERVGAGRYEVALLGVDEAEVTDGEALEVEVAASERASGDGPLADTWLGRLLASPVRLAVVLLALLVVVAAGRGLLRSRR